MRSEVISKVFVDWIQVMI